MKKLSKYYSKKAAFLKCPHCMAETHVGHFAWSAIACLNCGKMVNKEDWFLSDWQDAEQSLHSDAGESADLQAVSNVSAESTSQAVA